MLVNKSGRKLVIGRLNVKNGESFPGIPYTADERKGIDKFIKKGYIVEEVLEEPKKEPVIEEQKAEDPKVESVEESKVEPVNPVETVEPVEVTKAEPEVVVTEATVEPVATGRFSRKSRRRKAAEE